MNLDETLEGFKTKILSGNYQLITTTFQSLKKWLILEDEVQKVIQWDQIEEKEKKTIPLLLSFLEENSQPHTVELTLEIFSLLTQRYSHNNLYSKCNILHDELLNRLPIVATNIAGLMVSFFVKTAILWTRSKKSEKEDIAQLSLPT